MDPFFGRFYIVNIGKKILGKLMLYFKSPRSFFFIFVTETEGKHKYIVPLICY